MKRCIIDTGMLIKSIIIAAALVLLCVPCFQMTGNFLLPVALTLFGSLFICLVSSFFNNSESAIGLSLIFFNIFWLVFALVKEFVLQIEAGFVFKWIYFFYFDKLLIIGIVWLGCSLFITFKRIFFKNISPSRYDKFFKFSSFAFIIFYAFLLIYSFILIRLETGVYPFRFRPFVTIAEYIDQFSEIPYEIIMMVLGNLFYFTPLGYIFSSFLAGKKRIVKYIVNGLFPVITFSLLEFSQYVFQNGFCEFDDMLMNSIGFWFGNLLYFVFNFLAVKFSGNRVKRFWN